MDSASSIRPMHVLNTFIYLLKIKVVVVNSRFLSHERREDKKKMDDYKRRENEKQFGKLKVLVKR